MKILVVGGGGREHALAWKIAQSPTVNTVFVAPGNAGTLAESKCRNVELDAGDVDGLVDFAAARDIYLTIVGPEAPLVAGIVDRFAARGLRCFGPSAAAAQLEGSKHFTKEFLGRHRIPTASYATFTDREQAHRYVLARGAPIVVKADGLAAGKGVTVARTVDEALRSVDDCLARSKHGTAGNRVVIEECLTGEEASFICIVGGTDVLALATSQDHKARDDGDLGPNTGGMGAYSPAPVIDAALHARVLGEVFEPTVRGLAADGIPYTGFLYAGLMITPSGDPQVLEFNCRFGDPETQPILMRMRSDLVELCEAALDGCLSERSVCWDPRPALGVVLAAGGYPGRYRKGDVISGLDSIASEDVKVFHAGTTRRDGAVVSDGGRVLCVTALGDSVRQARARAYRAVDCIDWADCYYRTDIGYRAVARERD